MKKRVSEIMEKFQKAKAKRQQKDKLWQELDAFARNDQWSLADAPPWLPKPVTNYVHLVMYVKRAAFAVENPTGKLRPMSPKGVEAVKLLNKAYEDTVDRIKLRKVVRENIGSSKLLGTSIAQMLWDETTEGRMGSTVIGDEGFMYEGDIKAREIEISSFYPDPNAFSIEDCEYIFIRERKPLAWIKNHPKFKASWSKEEESEAESNSEDRGEIYLRDYTTEQKDGLITFTTFYEKTMNKDGGFDYTAEYLAGNKLLLDKPEKLRPNRYPFAILYDFKQRQDFWGMSTCEFILDNQKIINKVESIIAMIGTLLQNPQKVVSLESNIDPKLVAKFGSAPQQVWQSSGDPSKAIHVIQPPQIPNVLFNMLEQAKQNIREVTGITESYMGQNVGSLQTSSGVQALIDRSTMRDRDQMYDIEMYIEDLSHLLIDFMTEYYEEERMIRTMGKNEDEIEFTSFVGTEFKDLAYDIHVDVSAKAPITRMREMQDAKELLNLQGQYGANYPVEIIKGQEAIEMMNFVHGDRIIERMNMDEMRNKVGEAMQVAQMIAEAQQQGVPQEEINGMAEAMFQQLDPANQQQQQQGGSTQNPQNIPQGV